jgi:hypothetical protein
MQADKTPLQTPKSMSSSITFSDYGPESLNLAESERTFQAPGPYIVEAVHGTSDEFRVITVAELNEDTAHNLHNKAVHEAVKQAEESAHVSQFNDDPGPT